MLLRLSVNMYVFCDSSFVAVRAMSRAYSSARSMFGSLGSLSAIRSSLLGLYTPKPTMSPMPCSSSSTKEPFVYVHCCGLYLGVFMWWNMLGRGVVLLCKVDRVGFGIARQKFVNLTL